MSATVLNPLSCLTVPKALFYLSRPGICTFFFPALLCTVYHTWWFLIVERWINVNKSQDSIKTLDTHKAKMLQSLALFERKSKCHVLKILCKKIPGWICLKIIWLFKSSPNNPPWPLFEVLRGKPIFHFHVLLSQSLLKAVPIVWPPNHRKHQEVVGNIHFLSHFPWWSLGLW